MRKRRKIKKIKKGCKTIRKRGNCNITNVIREKRIKKYKVTRTNENNSK